MNLSAPFVARPVATTLLTIGMVLAGLISFNLLPVSPLPQVDYPTISVRASLPGASPETMAATVATPLERALGTIAGVTEITSSSSLSSTRVTLQFDLNRDIDGAARDVQAAINAARTILPTSLPSLPSYRKVNPADAPIMILALTSDTMTQGQMYDIASSVLAQKLSQVDGVGEATVGGGALPAVRVEANPAAVAKYGLGMEDLRTAINNTNVNRPKGALEDGDTRWQVLANDQARTAADYMPIIVSYSNGAPVRLSDVAQVIDSQADIRNAGSFNGRSSISIVINRQPGANIIDTVDRIQALLPQLRASIPGAINLDVALDRSPTIRASLHQVETTLFISIALVILVVFLFLRNARATLIPIVAVPVSLVGTFGVMYLCGFSLNNLSLMAVTIATGFVVDDAIVVLENVSRHIEAGMSPFQATLRGAREVGFTVLSMSLSLIAVFIPILMMGGIVGRLFREFAVTLSASILVSLLASLTVTPMMCARLLRRERETDKNRRRNPVVRFFDRVGYWSEAGFDRMRNGYERSLGWALGHGIIMMLILAATVALNVYLYIIVPKGFFPQQDTGRLVGFIQADQAISFQAMRFKLSDFIRIVQSDPDVVNVIGFTGGGQRNAGSMFVTLRPLGERKVTADRVIARLRAKLAREPGANLFLQSVQDIRVGGRSANAQYQYTLQADDLDVLTTWEPKVRVALTRLPELTDVNTDQQDKGLQTSLVIDRATASRLGVTASAIDSALNDMFGQRQVSTIYNPLNQYHVVLEAAPQFWQSPETLKSIFVPSNNRTAAQAANLALQVNGTKAAQATTVNPQATSGEAQVPLSDIAHYEMTSTRLSVNHQGQFPASTISFNLPPDVSLSDATNAINGAMAGIGAPTAVHGSFQGTAQAFQASLDSQPWLIVAAIIAVYIVLGVLYESTIHPITILSTLPSAGVGALLALLAFKTDFSIIALIGVILLIGIVKKNAIMMIDFALDAERSGGKSPRDAIHQACVLRFRPIMMTTMAAILGAIPLALGTGDGAEMRQPLGISIVGGLLVSQALTLYTTPVVYLYLERSAQWVKRRRQNRAPQGIVASTSGQTL